MRTKEIKGITIISLVVTIVVLLILAGISINLVLGNNGIIAKAKEAKKNVKISRIKEEISLYISGKLGDYIEPQEVFEYLKQDGLIDSEAKLEGIWIDIDGIKVSTINPNENAIMEKNNSDWVGGIINENEYGIINYTGKITSEIIIPDYIDGHLVTKISGKIVNESSEVASVVIPDSIKIIEGYSFYKCTNLKSVKIPYLTEKIGDGVFLGCTSLKEVIFNEKLKNIGLAAFQDCVTLAKIETPTNLKEIGISAFSNCSNLEEIILNNGLENVGNAAFSNCTSVKKLQLGSGIKTIGDYVFSNMRNIENDIYISNSITKIGEQAFKNVGADSTGTIYINEENVEVGNLAFYNCKIKKYNDNNISMKNVEKITTLDNKYAFLTFDDGPSYDGETEKILDILKKKNIKATFFMIGSMVKEYPSMVLRAYNEGHYIANHGYSTDLSKTYASVDSVINEFNETEKAIGESISKKEYKSNLLRFPRGFSSNDYKDIKIKAAEKLKQEGIYYLDWTCDINDAAVKEDGSRYTVDEMFQRFKDTVSLNSSNVILMHNFSEKTKTETVLEKVINYLEANNFEFKNMYDLVKIF